MIVGSLKTSSCVVWELMLTMNCKVQD